MIRLGFTACIVASIVSAAYPADDGFQPLFNGQDLAGWEGRFDLWKVENGAIVGNSPGLKENHFLVTKDEYGNGELRFEVKLHEPKANSGVQFWSQRVPNSTEMSGYQADIGQGWWGCLYDESRRNKMLAAADAEKMKALVKEGDWNLYVVRAEGNKVTLSLNGVETATFTELDAAIPRSGKIGLQVHAGGPFKVEFRNLRIKRLP